ncbi:MAG: Hsp20/alpha crystallin family protein [Elusimicrobiales bacterium]|nr:Hsp20/alpha crystallin family protein [Elusimicrobiales bacterium]
MHSKHAVHHNKHNKHLVPARKHPAHTTQARTHTAELIRPFESLGNVVDDLLNFPMAERNLMYTPAVDIRETDKTIEVAMALSGIDKKDINLDLTEDSLTISGERNEKNENKRTGSYEQSYSNFYRSFNLPAPVKTGDAKAVYKNGTLKVTMHKLKPSRLTVE